MSSTMKTRILLGWGTLTGLLSIAGPSGLEAATAPGGAGSDDVRRDAAVLAVEKVLPTVVNIRTETIIERRDPFEQMLREFWGPYYRRPGQEKTYSLGSGVMIDEDGWVLTNFHVVNRANRVLVKLADGREFEAQTMFGTSYTDVALLHIVSEKKEKFTAARFAADDDVRLAETVLALGNPFGLGVSVSRGIISSKSRRPPAENEPLEVEDWLQTDAAINPGSSGGPLINLHGEIVGISVAVYREGQGIGFAIPVKRVSEALSEIYTPETVPGDTRAPRLWFGANVRPGTTPLTVRAVQAESPAWKAGLRERDAILQVNGRTPRSFIDFNTEVINTGDKRDLTLRVQQGGAERTLSLRLLREDSFFNAALIRGKIGASVQDLTPKLAQAFGLRDISGVVVSDVESGSPAAKTGLIADMIITAINDQAISSQVVLAKTLHARKKGDKVTLEVLVPRQRGPMLVYYRERTELQVR